MSWSDLSWVNRAYKLVDSIEANGINYIRTKNPIFGKAYKSSMQRYLDFRKIVPSWALNIIDKLIDPSIYEVGLKELDKDASIG